MPEKYLRITEVAQLADCAIGTVYNAERDGRIKTILVGGFKFVTEREAKRFAKARQDGLAGPFAEFKRWKAAQRTGQEA